MAKQTWTDPALLESVKVKDTHFEELMNAINDWEDAYNDIIESPGDTPESHYTQPISQINENVKLSSFVEVDSHDRLEITTNTIAFTNLQINEQAYAYKDYGISGPLNRPYFSKNFNQYIDVKITAAASIQYLAVWMLSNQVEDLAYHRQYEKYLAIVVVRSGNVLYLELEEGVGGSYNTDSYVMALNTTYYLRIVRDETVGAYGTIYCYIYSDSNRTILLDTLQFALSSFENFRNLYGINSYGSSTSTYKISGTISNLQIPKEIVDDISIDEMQNALDALKTIVDGDTFVWSTADPGDIITGGDPADFVDQLRTNIEYFQDNNCYLCHTCDSYSACSCDLTCYDYVICTCNSTCYNQGCTCNAKCYGYVACSCNSTCYGEGKISCTCDNRCYGYSACSCNATCYGYIACSCDNTCYSYTCSKCDITDYEYPWS